MRHCPQKAGVCLRVGTTKPKKPNSAVRKIAKIALVTGEKIRAVIPGSGHNLQEYHSVLVQAGRSRDIPGIHYRLIRGKGDLNLPSGFARFNRRSKFSIPNWVLQMMDSHDRTKVVFIGCRLRSLRQTLEEENGLPRTWSSNKYYFSRAVRRRSVD